jgi:hypothetical protein
MILFGHKLSLIVSNFGPVTQFSASNQAVSSGASGTVTQFQGEGEAIEFGYERPPNVAVRTGVDTGGGFKIQFHVQRGDQQTPNSCDIRIFNAAPSTVNKLAQREYSWIQLQAGYPGSFGLIFKGTIKQTRSGKLDARNTFLDITAADGDSAYNYSALQVSLKAGAKPADAVQSFLASLGPAGVAAPNAMPPLSGSGLPRGRVYYGLARDEIRDWAAANNLVWSIQDGALTFIPVDSYLPGTVVQLGPGSGLVDVPQQTQRGIEMRSLLNSQLKIGQLVELSSNTVINQLRYGLDQQSQAQNPYLQKTTATNLARDGKYYIMNVKHSGDTRGTEWYSDLVCLATTAQLPTTLPGEINTVFPADAVTRF